MARISFLVVSMDLVDALAGFGDGFFGLFSWRGSTSSSLAVASLFELAQHTGVSPRWRALRHGQPCTLLRAFFAIFYQVFPPPLLRQRGDVGMRIKSPVRPADLEP